MEDGNCVRSGIGITHWKTANQSVARFPSALEEVKFDCDQVTKEMTGIKVKGFAIWSINREGDGPFKAFRSLRGLTPEGLEHANRSIGQMVESVIRHQIANMTLDEVLRGRQMLRNKAKEELVDTAAGWGMWIETVEITDVTISSRTLFENLQAEFRNKKEIEASTLNLAKEKTITEQREANALAKSMMQAETNSKKVVYQAEQQLKADQQKAKVEENRQAIRRAQMDRENAMEVYQTKKRNELTAEKTKMSVKLEAEKAKLNSELAAERARQDNELNIERNKIALEKVKREHILNQERINLEQDRLDMTQKRQLAREQEYKGAHRAIFMDQIKAEQGMTEVNMRKAMLDKIGDIYDKLPLREMKVVNVNSGGGKNQDITGLLTGFMTMDEARSVT